MQDIYKDSIENNISKVADLPYFEGDFWPNVLEDIIKEQEQEEEEKRKREEAEAAAAEAEASSVVDESEEPCSMVGHNASNQLADRNTFLHIFDHFNDDV